MTHSKYAVKGVKKLLSLARTKIRLARQAGTVYTKPRPLPLVKILSGIEVNTIDEAERLWNSLKEKTDYTNPKSMADAAFNLMDIVEGVKHKYEPKGYFCLLTEEEIKKLLEEDEINLLLACQPAKEGVNLYIGPDPPKNAIHYGRVTTNLATLVKLAFPEKIKKLHICQGGKTLINNATVQALETYSTITN